MKRNAYILSLVLVFLVVFGAAAFASDGSDAQQNAPPVQADAMRRAKRVALIPLIDRTGGWLSQSGAERLMARMDRELHIPLNETMHWVDFLSEDEAAAALNEAIAAQGKKAKPELAARDAARKLDADLMLFLVVEHIHQFIYHSFGWEGEMSIESSARLVVYGYDARHDRLIKAPAWRFERTTYHPAYEAEELAMEALDEALREAHAKDAIFPLSDEKTEISPQRDAAIQSQGKEDKK